MERIPGEPVDDDTRQFIAVSVENSRVLILVAPVNGVRLVVNSVYESAAPVFTQFFERIGLVRLSMVMPSTFDFFG